MLWVNFLRDLDRVLGYLGTNCRATEHRAALGGNVETRLSQDGVARKTGLINRNRALFLV